MKPRRVVSGIFGSYTLSRPHCGLSHWNLSWILLAAALPALSDPLDNWTIVPSGTTNHLRGVAFGGGLFVAAGDFGTVLTSSNGTVWTPVTAGITNALRGVAYGQGRFVAVGTLGQIITSSDGLAWSAPSSGTLNQLNAVAAGDLGFVAAGNAGTILTSSDGSNWVAQASGTAVPFVGLGFGFGRIYAGADVNTPALFWSTNGAVWSYFTNVPPSQQPDLFNGPFAYGNGALLGVRIRGLFARSLDGDTWTSFGSPFFYCFGLTYARDTFVTVGGNFNGGQRTVGTSTNGINWQTRYLQNNEPRLLSVAYGQHRFVAVGDNGAILASAPLLWLSNPSASLGSLHLTLHGEPGCVYHIEGTTNFSTPSWREVGLVTNVADLTEFAVPLPPDSQSGFYRASAR